jgi:hypothetical protein
MVRPVTTTFQRTPPAPGRPESAVWQDAPSGLPGWAVGVLALLGVALLALLAVLAFA